MREFKTKDDFFDYYLLEHSNKTCRGLHYVGTLIGTYFFAAAVVTGQFSFFILGLASGYLAAWVGHFFFEHNKPASFHHPWASFKSDYRMLACFLSGNMKKRLEQAKNNKAIQ